MIGSDEVMVEGERGRWSGVGRGNDRGRARSMVGGRTRLWSRESEREIRYGIRFRDHYFHLEIRGPTMTRIDGV